MDLWTENFGEFYDKIDNLKNENVILAYDKIGKRLCVVKKYKIDILEIVKRLKQIENKHLPQIYRIIEKENRLFVVEEYIEGETLLEILKKNKNGLNEKFALNILRQLCDILILIHNEKIIHRDIKPTNIILTKNNTIKLIDFGIARIIKTDNEQDTEILGTKGYAPPEQYGFKNTNFASDIYSLGVTIKRILPQNYKGKLLKILNKCTAFDPNNRYQTAEELLSDLNNNQKKFFILKLILIVFLITIIGFVLYLNNCVENKNNTTQENVIKEEIEETKGEEEKIKLEETETQNKTTDTKTFTEEKSQEQNKQSENKTTHKPTENNSVIKTENIPNNSPKIKKDPRLNRVHIQYYFNGEILNNNTKVIPYNEWQNFPKDKSGRIYFPSNYALVLNAKNDWEKDYINPNIKITSTVGEENHSISTIKSDANFNFTISLNKYYFEANSCTIRVLLKSSSEEPPNSPPYYKEFTFWLEKKK